jgi:hypothetical protein
MKMRRFITCSIIGILFCASIVKGQTTYYGLNGGDPTILSDWGTVSGGSGTNPGGFTNPGDIFIIENGTTMTASTIWTVGAGGSTASTLQINSGGTLAMSTYLLTLASCNLTNSGTFSSSGGVTISGTAITSIGGFTTTGTVSCIMTGGTATLTGDMNAGALVVNGSGGTLALTSGPTVALYHNISGNITILQGSLKLTHSVLTIGGNFINSGGSYSKGSGTVHFNGTIAQQTNVGLFNNLRINNNNGGLTLTAATTLYASLTIGDSIAGSILYDGGYQISMSGSPSLNFISGKLYLGSLSAATTWPPFSAITAIGTGATVIYESGVAQTVATTYGASLSIPYQNLSFINGGTKTTSGAKPLVISGNWDVESPTALNANNTIVNLTGNLTGTGSITSGTGTISIGGNWTNNGIFTCGSGTVNYDGTTGNQTAAGLTYHNLTISNSSGITLSSNATVNTTLTLSSGNVTTGVDTLFVSNNATGAISYSNGWVAGKLKRAIATGANTYNFYIGTASSYAPVSINFTNVTNAGNVTANVTAGQEPNGGTPLNTSEDVNLYWTLGNSGIAFSSYSPTFTYNSGDIIGGATQSNFIVGEYTSSAWTSPTPVINAGSGPYTTQVSGITGFGDFAVGDACLPLTTVSISPTTNQNICIAGAGNQLTVAETGGGIITGRQWGKRSVSLGAITPISGAVDSTYTPAGSDLTIGTWFIVCTSTPTCGTPMVSNEDTVIVYPYPDILSISGSTICASPGDNGTITSITSQSGINYQLYDGNNNPVGTAQAGTGSVLTWSNIVTGNGYYVIGTNVANCTSTSNSVNILSSPNPVALVLTGSTICASPGGNGTITSTTSEIGVSYKLYDGNGNSVQLAQTGTGMGLVWSGVNAGIGYYVIGTNSSTCTSASNTVNVSTTPNPLVNITNNTGSSVLTCSTVAIYVMATGGTTYSWSGGNSVVTAADTLTTTGLYTVTVTSASGCTATSSVFIIEDNSAPNAGIINNTGKTQLTCATTSISVTATGGTSYAWSGGNTPLTAYDSITSPDTYIVTVTGSNGCTATSSILITQNDTVPTAGITNNTGSSLLTCSNMFISVTATGGEVYIWSGGNTPLTVSDSITTPGIYLVTVTGTNGCTATSSITITQDNTAPIAGISNNTGSDVITCTTTAISVTATGGTNYNWSGGNTPTTAANTFILPGIFTVTVTSDNGCTGTNSISITANNATPVVIITNPLPTCSSSTVDITAPSVTAGSTAGLTFTYWTDTTATSVYSTPTAATTGTYYIEGTNSGGCSTIEPVSVKINPVYSFTDNDSICKGTKYSWHGTNYTSTGTYHANYTSVYNCDSNYTLNLTVNSVDTGITINGITLTANATPAKYQWVDCDNDYLPFQGDTNQSFTASMSGYYAVIITQGSCTDTSACLTFIITGIGLHESSNSINIYPNPVSDELNIDVKGSAKNTNFEILNSIGQVVYAGAFSGKTLIQTSGLSSGVYLMKLETGGVIEFKEFVKE